MKILSVVGARPQFIKVKPIDVAFRRRRIKHVMVHTGQHYDYRMSKVFFDQLCIRHPDYNLAVGSGAHGAQTACMLERLEKVLLKCKPDMVIVYGDTNSTLAGALAAAKLHVPVAHVEAGLRSFNRAMPEEINRVLTDHAADLLFCPTKTAVDNLKKEGITKGVYLSGDVMFDVFRESLPLLSKRTILSRLNLVSRSYFLLTVHRQENTANIGNLKMILSALASSKETVVFPVHPRTSKVLKQIKGLKSDEFADFRLIEPVSYLDMLVLEKNAKKIFTDSGGVQKEAFWLGVPCVTLRDETEWIETLMRGENVLAGTDKKKIISAALSRSKNKLKFPVKPAYSSARRIVSCVFDFFK